MFESFLRRIFKSPGVVWVLAGLLLVLGAAAYRGLGVDLFPPLNFPVLSLVTEAPGFSSLEIERQVTALIESAAGGVPGVTKVRSVMATGISMVSAEFEWGTDMVTARQLILEALAQVSSQLPPEAQPSVESLSATLAMIEGYSLQGGSDPVALRDIANYQLKPRLQGILGVYKVTVMGGFIREYALYPNPFLMIKYGISLDVLRQALADNNILASPGLVNHFSQQFVLHANGQFENAQDIESIVVAIEQGVPVRVKDLARVAETHQIQSEDASENGRAAVLVTVSKQPSFDTISVAQSVAAEIAAFQKTLPAGFTIHNYYDQAQLVSDSIQNVKETVVIGAVLVVLVLLAFLRDLRLTLVATLSIPLSIVAAIVLMRALGIGLNIMSLGGLAVGTGIIVDDAIVVLENIFRHFSTPELSQGVEASEVIVRAASEVVKPVVVSTLTNIAIFLPMVFIAGLTGRLFSPVALTVTFALAASLVVALTVIPLLFLKISDKAGAARKEEEAGRFFLGYWRLLDQALNRPKLVVFLGLLPVVLAFLAYRSLDVEFLPDLDEGAILLNTDMPPGTSLSESRRVNSLIENWLKSAPGVVTVARHTGHAPGTLDVDSVNHSDIMAKLLPKSQRPASLVRLIDALKEKTSKLSDVNVDYLMPLADKINDAMGGIPFDLGVDLYGPDLDVLHHLAGQLLEKMKPIPGISDLRPPEDIPIPSLEIAIDKKKAGRLGISVRSVYDVLRAYSVGLEATSVLRLFKSVGVVLHFIPAERNLDLEALRSLPLRTAGGNNVPLEQVADLHYSTIPSKIYHEHLSRKVTIAANLGGRNASDVAKDVARVLDAMRFPEGCSWKFSGKYATQQSAMNNMAMVLLMAIAIVTAILWLEFKSFVQVGLILLTLPLAAVGAFLSLWLFGQTLNVSSMIGAIMLVGIVVRNGIILLDYMNEELRAGRSVPDAVRSAALKRARPILMTASVAILGLLPIATGWGTGSELLKPLAIAVMGGLLTSTLLTLFVLPCAALLAIRSK